MSPTYVTLMYNPLLVVHHISELLLTLAASWLYVFGTVCVGPHAGLHPWLVSQRCVAAQASSVHARG